MELEEGAQLTEHADTIQAIGEFILNGQSALARDLARTEYPFVPQQPKKARQYSEYQSMLVFVRDGFTDRYTGKRLVFPGLLRLLSHCLPAEFPYHPHWKVSQTHHCYWELFPTIDHVIPLARGGSDDDTNRVTTSMMMNTSKAHWTLEELGGKLHPPGHSDDWNGLADLFLKLVDQNRDVLNNDYIQRWYLAAIRAIKAG